MALSDEQKLKARFARIKRVYGLSKEQYDVLYTGTCSICLRPFAGSVIPVVDHNHRTGEIRGIICAFCNHRVVGKLIDGELFDRLVRHVKTHTGLIVPPKPPKRRRRKKTK